MTETDTAVRRPRYAFWLLASVPWIPGWRRPVIAAAAGAVVAFAGSFYAFLPV